MGAPGAGPGTWPESVHGAQGKKRSWRVLRIVRKVRGFVCYVKTDRIEAVQAERSDLPYEG